VGRTYIFCVLHVVLYSDHWFLKFNFVASHPTAFQILLLFFTNNYNCHLSYISPAAQEPKPGASLLRFPDHTLSDMHTTHTHARTHAHTHTHTPGSTSLNQRSARRTSRYLRNTLTSMPSGGFEPVKPGIERPQTHALHSAATAIGRHIHISSSDTDIHHAINMRKKNKQRNFL
jgi:hypothetical protein